MFWSVAGLESFLVNGQPPCGRNHAKATPELIKPRFATRAHPCSERSDWPVQTGANDIDAERVGSAGPLRRGREARRIFVAALGDNQNTVEVLDLNQAKRVATTGKKQRGCVSRHEREAIRRSLWTPIPSRFSSRRTALAF